MKALRLVSLAVLLGVVLFAVMGDAAPATQPDFSIGDVKVQTLKGYSYAYMSTQTTLNKIKDAVAELIPKLDAAIDSGALRPEGPVIFTFHGVTGQPDKPFTLDVGIVIKDKGTKPDGFTVVNVGAEQCATVLYTGPIENIGPAYGKLFGQIAQKGLQASDVTREVYLYWEGDQSENNIVQVQAVLSAPGM
jgi:effector-binding domain-containing protein